MTKPLGIFKRIFSAILVLYKTFRSLVLNLLFLFLVVLIISALMGPPPITVPQGAALVISPNGTIVEEESFIDPMNNLLSGTVNGTTSTETLLQDILDAIDIAKEDSAISAIVLLPATMQSAGFSKLQEIGAALIKFKQGGKKVYAVADNYTQGQYYLASYADEILLNPYGSVSIEGFSSYQLYYGAALEKLGVNMHIFRVGEFKSAVEPYELNGMSEAAKEANLAWLNDLWQEFVNDISNVRDLQPELISAYSNNQPELLVRYNGDTAQLALQSGLVDRISSRSDSISYLIENIGSDNSGKNYLSIPFTEYLIANRPPSNNFLEQTNKVAVIHASGTIYDGNQKSGNIGGDSLAMLISQARNDPSIKALVLRIDSPGGSAFASEVIRNELLQLKAVGKPYVVSMGSVAASGGYWIASPADQIWASSTTITGSIGIYGIYPSFENSLSTIGITADGVGTTNIAGAFTIGKELPENVSTAQQLVVQNGYNRFLNVVAEGRDMSITDVDAIAQGRVWSGSAALRLGLVDKLGNLEQAIAAAASLAGLDNFSPETLTIPLSPSELLLKEISNNIYLKSIIDKEGSTIELSNPVKKFYQQVNNHFQQLLKFNDPQGMYLQCFECQSN